MNVCVALFPLKMHEHKERFWPFSLCHFQKVTSTSVRQEKMLGVYGEDAESDGTCEKWAAKINAGDFS